jgi:hypothetical protein
MKLHELKTVKKHRGFYTQDMEIDPAGGIYGDIDVEVSYNFEGASSTLHIRDDPTTREHHSAEFEIVDIILTKEVEEYDEEGEKVIKTWPKGTDASRLPGWTKKDEEAVYDKLHEPSADDYEPDYDDHDGRRR